MKRIAPTHNPLGLARRAAAEAEGGGSDGDDAYSLKPVAHQVDHAREREADRISTLEEVAQSFQFAQGSFLCNLYIPAKEVMLIHAVLEKNIVH
jgi:hypothetical protein